MRTGMAESRRLCIAFVVVAFCFAAVYSHGGHGHHHHHDHDHDHGDVHAHHHGHHHHDHDHDHEPASFKYSKQANQPAAAKPTQPAPAKPKQPAPHSHGHDHHHGHAHSHGHSHGGHKHEHAPKKPSQPIRPQSEVWLYALGSTLAISIAPFLILFFIHIDINSPYLRVLLAFASGGLLGDAFLHLIPHAVPHSHGHDHDHHHEHEEHDHFAHTMVGVWVVGGIIAFLVVEKVLRHLQGGDAHSHDHGHSHSHSHSHKAEIEPKKTEKKKENHGDSGDQQHSHQSESASHKHDSDNEDFELLNKQKTKKQAEGGDSAARERTPSTKTTTATTTSTEPETKVVPSSGSGDIKVGGYLNLVADFAHNFTDGLAIGATYMAGQHIGLWTSFIILCHEIPHEIGDFALLVQSGCPRLKAIMLQLVTALGAFTGCFLSLFLGSSELQGKSSWVIPFTAGGFIYIGTVTIIPELLTGGSVKQSITELLAMLSGIGIMLVIALYEGEH